MIVPFLRYLAKTVSISTLFLFFLFPMSIAQLGQKPDTQTLSGKIPFWYGPAATVETYLPASARISQEGVFWLLLPRPEENLLEPVRNYGGADCLISTNANSNYTWVFDFDIKRDDKTFATLHLRTPRFDEQVGEAIKEWHYYSEATNVSGRCVFEFEDGVDIYEFPTLTMQKGWNELTGIVQAKTNTSATYLMSLADNFEFRWEMEPLEELAKLYAGIGVTIDLVRIPSS